MRVGARGGHTTCFIAYYKTIGKIPSISNSEVIRDKKNKCLILDILGNSEKLNFI